MDSMQSNVTGIQDEEEVNYDEFKKFANGCQFCSSCFECIFPDGCALYESNSRSKSKIYAAELPVSDKSPSLVKDSRYINRRRSRINQLKKNTAQICGEAIIDGIRLVIYKGKSDTYWAMNGKEYIEIPAKYIKDKWVKEV